MSWALAYGTFNSLHNFILPLVLENEHHYHPYYRWDNSTQRDYLTQMCRVNRPQLLMLAAVAPEPPEPPAHRVAENAVSSCLTVVLRWSDFVLLTVSGVIFIVIPGEILLISHGQRPDVQLNNTQNISAQKNHASPNSNSAGAESLGFHLEVAAPCITSPASGSTSHADSVTHRRPIC